MFLVVAISVIMLAFNRAHSFAWGVRWGGGKTIRRHMSSEIQSGGNGGSATGKRKVALVISYVGSNYHGLQINPSSVVPFVETKLVQALVDMEAILPTNAVDLGKIDWSRSSRTDKGVHAARLVISAKLEILPKWLGDSGNNSNSGGETMEQKPARYKKLVSDLNDRLPPDIRAMSCIRINNSFQARHACSWREYEYIVPLDALTLPATPLEPSNNRDKCELYTAQNPAEQSSELAVERLNAALQQFVGPQCFHNFNNFKLRQMNEFVTGAKHWEAKGKHDKHNNRNNNNNNNNQNNNICTEEMLQTEADTEDEATDNCAHETGVNEPQDTQVGAKKDFKHFRDVNVYENWAPVETPLVNQLKHIVYHAKASLVTNADGKHMVAVTFRGSGFILNQIRLMIGAAVLTARGLVPLYTIEAALKCPYKIPFLTAPAEGLFLKYAGFGYQANKTIGMSITNPGFPEDVYLLDGDEFTASEEFKNTHIRPRIMQDWYANDALLLRELIQTCERYRPSVEVSSQLHSLLQAQRSADETEALASAECYKRRVLRTIDDFHDALEYAKWRKEEKQRKYDASIAAYKNKLTGSKEAFSNAELVPLTHVSPGGTDIRDKRRAPREIKHRSLLPDTFHSDLLVHFDVYPGEYVDLALRALAYKIAAEQLAPGLSSAELLKKVDGFAVKGGKGGAMNGIDYLARVAPKHELII